MEKKTKSSNSLQTLKEDYSDELIKELLVKLWFKRKFIFRCITVFIILGLFIAFTSPVSYTANCTLVPQMGNQARGGSLGGLASMMGVNVGSYSNETLSPYVYPEIINSVPFCKEIMETPIVVNKSEGNTITLYDYYSDKKYRPNNVLSTIKKYTIGLPGVLISGIKPEKTEVVFQTDTIEKKILVLSSKERMVLRAIQGNIQFNSNEKHGYVTIGYSFPESEAAANIAQNMYETLEKYVKGFKNEKQQNNLFFVEESYERAQKDFYKKQAALASFQDANRDLTSATARATERRLSSEYEVAYTVYNELARQLEQTKISVNESIPILTVVKPVVVPKEKSAPKRALILIVFLFLGLIISIGWVFIKPFFEDLYINIKNS